MGRWEGEERQEVGTDSEHTFGRSGPSQGEDTRSMDITLFHNKNMVS